MLLRYTAFLRSALQNSVWLCAVLMAVAGTTKASSLWTWQLAGPGVVASGTFTTVDAADAMGGYLITGLSGTRNGVAITSLQAPGTAIPGNEPFVVDDLVYPGSGPQLTSDGFGFALADGTYSNPFFADFLPTPGYLDFFSMPPGFMELPVSFSATLVATPEPSSLWLESIAAGSLLLGLRMRRRN